MPVVSELVVVASGGAVPVEGRIANGVQPLFGTPPLELLVEVVPRGEDCERLSVFGGPPHKSSTLAHRRQGVDEYRSR
jgi:hypothetical protein